MKTHAVLKNIRNLLTCMNEKVSPFCFSLPARSYTKLSLVVISNPSPFTFIKIISFIRSVIGNQSLLDWHELLLLLFFKRGSDVKCRQPSTHCTSKRNWKSLPLKNHHQFVCISPIHTLHAADGRIGLVDH